MRNRTTNGDTYLKMYPKLRKWINQCLVCQREGYKPDLPDNIYPGVAAKNIRKFFDVLDLDENGLCSICAKIKK